MSIFQQNSGSGTEASMVCDRGGRGHNEDYADYYEDPDRSCYILCDGLGGHRGGEMASETVSSAFLRAITNVDEVNAASVRHALDYAQECLVKKNAADNGMGLSPRTTAAALAISGGMGYVCSVGDSRVYHIRDGEIDFVTNDHSVAFLSYLSGEIEYADIRFSPDQNRLMRSMGDSEKYNPESAEPIEVLPGDAFLLCSDGFWEYVTEVDMVKTLASSKTASRWLAKMVRILNKNTKKVNNNDNYSAITVFVG